MRASVAYARCAETRDAIRNLDPAAAHHPARSRAWTRPSPRSNPAPARRPDRRTFEFACDVVRRADELGFDTTLIAERFLGPDLSAWVLASALAMVTKRIELMVAVHPGMVTPQVVAKMASSLDRISGGRCRAEYRQRLVDGGIRPVQQRHLDRRRRALSAHGRVHPGDQGACGPTPISISTERSTAPMSGRRLTGADGKVVMPDAGDIVAKPSQLPYPPIYAASRSPQGKALIAQHCDVWFAEYKPGYRNFESNIERMAADVREMDALAAIIWAQAALCDQSAGDLLRDAGARPSGSPMRRSAMPGRATAW